MKKLVDFSFNKYSQFGEDGIIEKIFEIIGTKSKTCVEFGAWDGFHLSNTANLWTRSWKGVLIEGKKKRFERLKKNTAEYGCLCIHAFVEISGDNSLDSLLKKRGVSNQIDLLSIDIDGNDYYIFESLNEITPRVVICEYNPTIPAELDLLAEKDNYFGCSVTALKKMAEKKGYVLISITQTNCIFVLEEYAQYFSEFDIRIESMKNDEYVNYFITSYSGEYVLSKDKLAFGATFPYKKKLLGEHGSVYTCCSIFRPIFILFRIMKNYLREILE